MKTRNALVSNSSSSSFIVRYKDLWEKDQPNKISQNEIKILKKNGFKLCSLIHPSFLDSCKYSDKNIWVKKYKEANGFLSYAKWVTCNQNNEICILVKNKIPFIASVHYGHYTYLYPRNSKYVYIFHNKGLEIETYHQEDSSKKLEKVISNWNQHDYFATITKISVKEYIKREEKLKELREEDENKNVISE